MIGPMLKLDDCGGRYFYDEEAADHPCRFITKYVRLYQGSYAGKPLVLVPWQDRLIRDLFGWRRKDNGQRRFDEVYCLTAKGAGKTPLMAALGLYGLVGMKEAAAHVISCATDFQQANLTLEAGKKYVAAHPALERMCDSKQFEIRGPRDSKWTVMSGTAEGRHGFQPSMLLMDEAHEWPNGLLYQNLTANTPKREGRAITFVITNAGESEHCFAWKLHSRALDVLKGKEGASESLLPLIFEAPITLDWQSEEAAKAANPSLGTITTFGGLASELAKAREDDLGEGRYRRLYLSQWGGASAQRWLDVASFDQRCEERDVPKDSALYIGLDLAQSDDLCAAVFVWPLAQDDFYVSTRFWVPKRTADRYEAKFGIPYTKWAEQNAITLVPEPTIGSAVQRRIADEVIATAKQFSTVAVVYDKYRTLEATAILEASGLPCVAQQQAWGVSEGTFELERRMIEGTIRFAANPVMRFCVENARVSPTNDRGQKWPVKPGANLATNYAGERGAKIDGVSALVTALTQARKYVFPAAVKQWNGGAWLVEL